MSGVIHLIPEGPTDVEIVRKIVNRHYAHIRVIPIFPPGARPNLTNLSKHIEDLIKTAIAKRKQGDCIAVIHDTDSHTQPHHRDPYNRIAHVCSQYKKFVKLINPKDEIEAWLLSDSKMCEWLDKSPRNFDEERQPSLILGRWLDAAGKPSYNRERLPRFLEGHFAGDGADHSPSLREALRQLHNAPCIER